MKKYFIDMIVFCICMLVMTSACVMETRETVKETPKENTFVLDTIEEYETNYILDVVNETDFWFDVDSTVFDGMEEWSAEWRRKVMEEFHEYDRRTS